MKPCNPKNPKAMDDRYVCNPKTGRWNLKKSSRPKNIKVPKRKQKTKMSDTDKFTNLLLGKRWSAKELRRRNGKGTLIRKAEEFGTITEVKFKPKETYTLKLEFDNVTFNYYPAVIRTSKHKRIVNVVCMFMKDADYIAEHPVVLRYNGKGKYKFAKLINRIVEPNYWTAFASVSNEILQNNLIGNVIVKSRREKQKNVIAVGIHNNLPYETMRLVNSFL